MDVADKGIEDTKAAFSKEDLEAGDEPEDALERRKRHHQAVLYAEEVKVLLVHISDIALA